MICPRNGGTVKWFLVWLRPIVLGTIKIENHTHSDEQRLLPLMLLPLLRSDQRSC